MSSSASDRFSPRSAPPDASAVSSTAASDLPSWVEDEASLRDEGVVFGLAGRADGDGIQAKTDCIRRHYDARRAEVQRKRDGLQAGLEQVDGRRETVQKEIERLEADIETPAEPVIPGGESPDVAPHYFLRYLVGLVLAVGLCGLNYVLVYELVEPSFNYPWFVAAGVLMAGMFALFQPSSLLYNNDADQGMLLDAPAELWKQRISEFGVPLAAALFAVVWRAPELGMLKTGVAFLFVLMLFLFGGKLFLSMLPKISLVARNVMRDRRIRRMRERNRERIEHLRDARLPDLDREERTLREAFFELPTDEEIDARCDRAIALFRSEVTLAQNAKTGAPRAVSRL